MFTVWYVMQFGNTCIQNSPVLFFNLFCTVEKKVHPFVPKNNRKLRNDDDLSYNHARQAERRGIAQTMESPVRYGTHTRLHVVLYTSRVPLFVVLCHPSERMHDDTTRGTSIFLGIYVLRQPTSTRTTSNVSSFSCTYIQMDW